INESLEIWRKTTLSIVLASAVVLLFVGLFAFIGSRRISNALNTQSARFTSAINNMSKGMLIMDAVGRIVLANDGFKRIYNMPAKLVEPGTSILSIFAY